MYVVYPSEVMLLIHMEGHPHLGKPSAVCVCVSGKVRGLCKYQMLLIVGKMQTLVKSLLVRVCDTHTLYYTFTGMVLCWLEVWFLKLPCFPSTHQMVGDEIGLSGG